VTEGIGRNLKNFRLALKKTIKIIDVFGIWLGGEYEEIFENILKRN
jgi:hypothetical protein